MELIGIGDTMEYIKCKMSRAEIEAMLKDEEKVKDIDAVALLFAEVKLRTDLDFAPKDLAGSIEKRGHIYGMINVMADFAIKAKMPFVEALATQAMSALKDVLEELPLENALSAFLELDEEEECQCSRCKAKREKKEETECHKEKPKKDAGEEDECQCPLCQIRRGMESDNVKVFKLGKPRHG